MREAEVEANWELQRSVRRYYFPPYFEQLSGSSHNSLSSEVVDALANACPTSLYISLKSMCDTSFGKRDKPCCFGK